MTWTYGYNPAGQITQTTRSNDAFAFTDSASGALSYTSNGLNQYTQVGATAFCHDANGNLSDDGDHVFQYDSENKLTVKRLRTLAAGTCPTPATGYGGTVRASLSHDPLDRLYQASGGGEIVRMAYDGLDLIAEYDSSNGLLRRYVHGPGMDEPLVWYEGSGLSDRRWLHADERGSIVKATTGTGATLFTNSYDEYGVPGAANQGRFQYTGQLWIRGLEMYHYKARTYAPALGRFLQPDPTGYADGMNLYAYVGNDPVNFTDPLGLVTEEAWDDYLGYYSVDGTIEVRES